MSYKQYHTALVLTIVLQKLLQKTVLEIKAFDLYADIVELERVPKHQIKTASKYAKRIVTAIERDEIKPPSPFTLWQRFIRVLARK